MTEITHSVGNPHAYPREHPDGVSMEQAVTTDSLAVSAGMTKRDAPRADGALLGKVLASLAKAGRLHQPDLPDPCATCAFRQGCMTNAMPATVLTAFRCAIGADDAPFGCHHGMVDGKPIKACAGWMAAQAADWPDVQRITAGMDAALAGLPERDDIRERYDAWIARIDPDGALDDYQRGRLWLRDNPCGLVA